MKNLEITINKILENINDSKYWYEKNTKIKEIFQKEEAREYLKKKLSEGKKYSALKLIARLGIKYEDKLYLNYYNYKENYNFNLYTILFDLFICDLLTKDGITEIREKYKEISNFEKSIKDVEKKCLEKKIECERYFYKKRRCQKDKILDRKKELYDMMKIADPISRSDLENVEGINFDVQRIFILDVTNYFQLETDDAFSKTVIKEITTYVVKYFESAEKDKIDLFTLNEAFYKDKEYGNEESESGKKFKLDNDLRKKHIENYIDDFMYLYRKHYFKNDFAIFESKPIRKNVFAMRTSIGKLRERLFPVYLIANEEFGFLLAQSIVFYLSNVGYKNIISYRNKNVDDVIEMIKKEEKCDKVLVFGKFIANNVYKNDNIHNFIDVALNVEKNFEKKI